MSITKGLPRPVFTINPLRLPVVQIQNGTFYQQNGSSDQNRLKLFPRLSLNVPPPGKEIWAIVGPGSCGKTTLLEILRGLHICDPPRARQFPALTHAEEKDDDIYLDPLKVIKYVGFGSTARALGPAETRGAYLSARFESRREASDFSLADYLVGNVKLNPDEGERAAANAARKEYFFQFVAERMNLHNLLDMPVSNLSNGQTRRARVGKALMSKPRLLLLDEPFIGLDPMTKKSFNNVLHRLIRENDLPIVFALQAQEEIPSFVSHVLMLDSERQEEFRGRRDSRELRARIKLACRSPWKHLHKDGADSTHTKMANHGVSRESGVSKKMLALEENSEMAEATGRTDNGMISSQDQADEDETSENKAAWWDMNDVKTSSDPNGKAVVEMAGIKVAYGNRTVIGDWEQEHDKQQKPGLWWDIKPGDRWGVFGPNGSGKTTLLSLICSDHPQAYSLPIKLFGRSRLPTPSEPSTSIFDLQARIGQSSPEILNFFPKKLTVRQTLESAWADTFMSKARLSHEADEAVDACLRWFAPELAPARHNAQGSKVFGERQGETLGPRIAANLCDEYMAQEIDWAEDVRFRELSLEGQKVALFLRAIVKKPELVILDEAFSGMDEDTRGKCMLFLAYGEGMVLSQRPAFSWYNPHILENRARLPSPLLYRSQVTVTGIEPRQALLCVSHRRQEVPPILQQWLCLPESAAEAATEAAEDAQGETPAPSPKARARFGTFRFGNAAQDDDWRAGSWWQRIWGGEGWSPDGSYMMMDNLPQYKWQNQRRRKGYDIRTRESNYAASTWLKRFKGAEARRQRTEWLAGQRARADWQLEAKAKSKARAELRSRMREKRRATSAVTSEGNNE